MGAGIQRRLASVFSYKAVDETGGLGLEQQREREREEGL